MKTIEKEQIRTKLAEFCEIKGGQNKAANSMRGVSPATISQVLNNNWDLISEEMWRTIASQIGYDPRAWVVVETRGYKRMYGLLQDAQDNSLVFAVTGDAGCGKSEAIKSYAASNRNVYNLSCSEYWNRKHFMAELLQCMGIDSTGCTVPEMMSDIILALKKKETPLVVLDEADKLSDQVLYFSSACTTNSRIVSGSSCARRTTSRNASKKVCELTGKATRRFTAVSGASSSRYRS